MSKSNRKKSRRFLMQILYARIYNQVDFESFYGAYFDNILNFSVDKQYIEEMMGHIVSHQSYVIKVIEYYAPKFDFETMLKTNILAIAIAICEMKFLKEEIPGKVSINEAVEIAKYFGDDSSKKIVNGILNSYYEDLSASIEDTSFTKASKHSLFST